MAASSYLDRFLALTAIVAVLSIGLTGAGVVFYAPNDAYAGAVYAKVFPIIAPLYAAAIFSVLWFLGCFLYALFLRRQSPVRWSESWQVTFSFCAASFLSFVIVGVTAFNIKRSTDTYKNWDSMAKSSDVDLKTFKPLVDEFRREYDPHSFKITWRHQVLAEAAFNPSAQADFLSYCVQQLGDIPDIMNDMAENPHTPETALRAFYQSTQMHPYLAKNPSTPSDILTVLAHSDAAAVRGGVAANPQVPQELLEELAHDKENWIRAWASDNLAKRATKSTK